MSIAQSLPQMDTDRGKARDLRFSNLEETISDNGANGWRIGSLFVSQATSCDAKSQQIKPVVSV